MWTPEGQSYFPIQSAIMIYNYSIQTKSGDKHMQVSIVEPLKAQLQGIASIYTDFKARFRCVPLLMSLRGYTYTQSRSVFVC